MDEHARAGDRLLAILSYHKVGDAPPSAWEPWNYVPEPMLAEQLSALRDDGWAFVDLRTALDGLADRDALPPRSVLVTFDDAYRSLPDRALPVLRGLGCPAVVFVPTAFVGGLGSFDAGLSEPLEPICGWDDLRALEAAGVSVQSHGVNHVRLSTLRPRAIEDELAHSKATLEDALGKRVEVFAFPYGDGGSDRRAVSGALTRCGYRAACLYGGRPVSLPAPDPFGLDRLAVGYGTDVVAELAVAPAAGG